jgi:hypothetical protein
MSHQLPKETLSTEQTVDGKEMFLVTAGTRIKCLRCTAKSTRTGVQCAKPALRISPRQLCGHHGGKPHSAETIKRISAANTVHSQTSKAAKKQYRDDSVLIHELEDALYALRMASGPRTRGRKPNGYRGVYSEADVIRMIRERVLNRM